MYFILVECTVVSTLGFVSGLVFVNISGRESTNFNATRTVTFQKLPHKSSKFSVNAAINHPKIKI